jgi:hypothetical protein
MYLIEQIKSLADATSIDQIEFTLDSIGPERKSQNPGWASQWLGKAKDGNAFASVTFSLKKSNPEAYVGKRILVTCGKDKEGRPSGIKTKANGQYMNLWITDSAKIQIVDEGGAVSAPAASAPRTAASASAAKPQVSMSPEAYAKHLATEWCTVYDWTSEIFKTRLAPVHIKECVTGVVIEMRRAGVQIANVVKDSWRTVEFKGEKLGDWDDARIKAALAKIWRGAKVVDAVKEAFEAIATEPEFAPSHVFAALLTAEGITDMESVDTVLLREMLDRQSMSEADYKTIISNAKFIEDVKQLIATKHSMVDDSDAIDL